MDTVSLLVVAICIILVIRVVLAKRREKKRLAAEEAKRLAAEQTQKAWDEAAARAAESRRIDEAGTRLNEVLPEILRLHKQMDTLTSFSNGYLMKKDWDAFVGSIAPIRTVLAGIPNAVIESSEHSQEIKTLMERTQDPNYRTRRNEQYKTSELQLCDALFSNVDGGKSLDAQQRNAIVTDEYSNLVIAGAGSGKTSVVVGKVKYLVERWNVDPSQILVTSFTRASVDDLKRRIEASGVKGVAARTFHSLGLRVLGDGVAVAQENALLNHVTSYLSGELASHSNQASAFLEFFGMWNLVPKESPDSQEAEARMSLLKAQDMRTLKGLVEDAKLQGAMDTMQGERVKSVEELMIANFLFLNGVAYEYERPYDRVIPDELREEGRRAYQPDFYLPEYDIWLEHFGIDEHGRVPWMKTPIEERAYIDGMNWKRKVHAACGSTLIESYSYWNKDQDLLNRVEALLIANGVVLRIDPERNARLYGDLLRDERFFGSMAQLICTFISLVKSNNKTAPEVDDTAREAYRGQGSLWHRYDLFTRFTWPIMESYQKTLAGGPKPLVDFDDMINEAARRVRANGYTESYRYIIVDEYQDISLSRFGLLSAIRNATGAKLVCVGDDWQAIYRFAGSDVTLFTSFGKLVGYHEQMRIERTYRNSQALVDVASGFVLKNPDQLRKRVVSNAPAQPRPPVAVISLADQQAAFAFALNDLLASGCGGEKIKVLGRNKRDLERIFPGLAPTGGFSFRNPKRNSAAEEKFDKVITYRPSSGAPVEVGYMTVHKSKGLQADNVIVIGLVNDRYGFPNTVADDPILELLLANSDRYTHAEERRLFYVALTRTKNRVWLVTGTDSGYPGISRFVRELRKDNDGSAAFVFYSQDDAGQTLLCPRCGGVLLRRQGPNGDFVGCSNYPFCDKTYRDVRILSDQKRCPSCEGWLTRRRGPSGEEFYGCTNYPRCCYTMSIEWTGTRGEVPTSIPLGRGANGYSADAGRKYGPTANALGIEYQQEQPRRAEERQDSAPRCPKCGARMTIKNGRRGKFYSCTRFPKCKGSRDYKGSDSNGRQYPSRQSRGGGDVPRCPKCGSKMVLRSGKRGRFYGCSRYPSCMGTRDFTS